MCGTTRTSDPSVRQICDSDSQVPFAFSLYSPNPQPSPSLTSTTSPSPRHETNLYIPYFFPDSLSIHSLAFHTLSHSCRFARRRLNSRTRTLLSLAPSFLSLHRLVICPYILPVSLRPRRHRSYSLPTSIGTTASFFLHRFPAFALVASFFQYPYLATNLSR